MNKVSDGLWEWAWFSTEKKIHFNGHFLILNERKILVDPPLVAPEDEEMIRKEGVDGIVITNRDHIREAEKYRTLLDAPIWMPEADAGLVETPVDHTFGGGEILFGAIEAVHIPDGKSPGESALFYPSVSRGVLILGDALIGKPEGELNLLPHEKFQNVKKAVSGLEVLLPLSYDMVLVGDGASLLKNGKEAVYAFFKRMEGRERQQ